MTMPDVFTRTASPAALRSLAINRFGRWYTWSVDFLQAVRDCEAWLRRLPEPELIHLPGLGQYDYTFTLATVPPPSLRAFMPTLGAMRRPRGIMLFTGLLDGPLDGFLLRRLFALMRDGVAAVLRDERYSLYAPLGATGRYAGDFTLHADLYLPELLFNVFEEVPADSSGASIFLHILDLYRLIDRIDAVPSQTRRMIATCFRDAAYGDRFGQLFGLLHDHARPGILELEAAMRARQLTVRLGRGQGYLIHDRTWLHGREAPSGAVPTRRLHRLVFNTLAIQRRVTAAGDGAPRAADRAHRVSACLRTPLRYSRRSE